MGICNRVGVVRTGKFAAIRRGELIVCCLLTFLYLQQITNMPLFVFVPTTKPQPQPAWRHKESISLKIEKGAVGMVVRAPLVRYAQVRFVYVHHHSI